MSDTETEPDGKSADSRVVHAVEPAVRKMHELLVRLMSLSITLAATGLAALLGWAMWDDYMTAPWTRDATVRTYVVTMAPEVAGRIVELPIADNQFVHKGDLLLVIDPTNYRIAHRLADEAVAQAQATADNAQRQAERRRVMTDLAETVEDRQTYEANAAAIRAQYQQAVASRDQAKVNLERTEIRSPVNGWATNLLARLGDYATVGRNTISIVDADSFWVDAYFEETQLASVHEGDPASIKFMGYSRIVRGEVSSVARGINVSNAQSDPQGLATVNPIFTWVRLAQRVPVHIRIDQLPAGVRLVAGMTATVQLDAPSAPLVAGSPIDPKQTTCAQ
ncbi:efflux RND transporter periplasmic adaptor subunit [Bradyrhizobium genosp. A]|uniref:efflux RND transporter periplasmic adaptor subunit n=1 Tax=Bradyrhizobium genosp. A TaxID=83626 RepID=UPI003CEBC6C0